MAKLGHGKGRPHEVDPNNVMHQVDGEVYFIDPETGYRDGTYCHSSDKEGVIQILSQLPNDFELVATLTGNFYDEGTEGTQFYFAGEETQRRVWDDIDALGFYGWKVRSTEMFIVDSLNNSKEYRILTVSDIEKQKMKTVLIKIDREKWPEAPGWAHEGFYIEVDKLKLFRTHYKRFGTGPEEPIPEEYIRVMKDLMVRHFSKLVNWRELEAEGVDYCLTSDFMYEWIEEDLVGALDKVVINFAMEHGLTVPVITQEYMDSLSPVVPNVPKLDIDQVNFLMGLVDEHGLASHVMESIAYTSEMEEEGESGDPAMFNLKSSREFIQELISKLQEISNNLNR